MQFEWDEQKNAVNIAKHGIDFVDAPSIFAAPVLTALDTRQNYGEDRWIGIGLLRSRAVVVVYTEPNENVIRIISVRKALIHEQKRFEEHLKNELGAS